MTEQQIGFSANIAPELQGLAKPIHSYVEHPENPRLHNIGRIQESLQRHGQRSLVIVQKSSGFIVKGNGTHEAAVKLGWQELAFDVHEMDDEQAQAYLLADNRASDQAKYDNKKLIGMLESMVAGPGLAGTLFDVDDIDDLIAEEDAVPAAAAAAFTGGFNESEEASAARAAAGKAPGDKRREVPLVFNLDQHALFTGWLRVLQKRWKISGVMATVYTAVKRQAEAEEGGVVPVRGQPLAEDVRVAERRAALKDFRDLLITMGGAEREFKGLWLLTQLQGAMSSQEETEPVSGGSAASAPVEPEEPGPEPAAPPPTGAEAPEAYVDAAEPGLFAEFADPNAPQEEGGTDA